MDTFDEICGYTSVKKELERFADFLRRPDAYERMGVKMPAGLLLDGAPGLGKTLMANCLIEASGLEAFTCRKSKRGANMLKAIRKTFKSAAESAPAIVFLDDIDKFSNSDYDRCDTEEYVTVQSCIDEHRGDGVFVVATANNSDKLPKSLLREGRFDRTIRVEAPQGADALAVTERYLAGIACAPDVDAKDVADIVEGHSCALIETVINQASLVAGFEGADAVTLVHFARAYALVEGSGRLSELELGSGLPRLVDAWATERAQVAFHEAGHIVAEETLRPRGALTALIMERQGRLSGLAKGRHLDRQCSFAEMRADILVTLAGSVAVERKYGIPCLGCSDDNRQVADAVKRLMWDAMSNGAYFAAGSEYSVSEMLSDAREKACAVVVEQYRWEVRELLARNWSAVERVAEMLYARGFVLPRDISAAMSDKGFDIRTEGKRHRAA